MSVQAFDSDHSHTSKVCVSREISNDYMGKEYWTCSFLSSSSEDSNLCLNETVDHVKKLVAIREYTKASPAILVIFL